MTSNTAHSKEMWKIADIKFQWMANFTAKLIRKMPNDNLYSEMPWKSAKFEVIWQ